MRQSGQCGQIDDFRRSLRSVVSVETIDLLLDTAELVTIHPWLDETSRLALWIEILSLLAPYGSRLEVRHHRLMEELGAILGTSEEVRFPRSDDGANSDVGSKWSWRIGIYTLREEWGAGQSPSGGYGLEAIAALSSAVKSENRDALCRPSAPRRR